MLIVAGGWDGSSFFSTTELMTYSPGSDMKWRLAGPLPRIMDGVKMVNLNNYIFLFGGHYYSKDNIYYDGILQYKDGVWINVGKMKTKRAWHAVSVINYKDVCKSG